MKRSHRKKALPSKRRAFTLVELVIVVTIIGIISAIAVPRMSTTNAHASANAVQATLSNVRTAIDLYYAEHNRFPGKNPGAAGALEGAQFTRQLTMYSDANGNTNQARTTTFKFGPYLRAPFPENPANNLATVHVKQNKNDANPADGSVGWIAIFSTGDFGVSATDSQLDEIGIVEPTGKAAVRLQAN